MPFPTAVPLSRARLAFAERRPPHAPEPPESRFWRRVRREGGCLVWTGYRNRFGYGVFGVGRFRRLLAHRYSYMLKNGRVPAGAHVAQSCGRKACVAPAHLVLLPRGGRLWSRWRKAAAKGDPMRFNPYRRVQLADGIFARLVPDRVDLAEIHGVEIFSTGTHAGITWTERDLRDMADNFSRLRDFIRPPLKLGHDTKQVLDQSDGQPALGWISALRVEKDKLVADFSDVPSELVTAINARRYARVSAEIYPAWQDTSTERNLQTGVTGSVIAACALLGGEIPECKNLKDLPRLAASDTDKTSVVTFTAVEGRLAPAQKEPAPMTAAQTARMTDHEREVARLRDQIGRSLTEAKAIAERILGRKEGPSADGRKDMGGFDKSVAADVGPLAHTFMDQVEAVLQQAGLDRENVSDRSRAASIARRLRPDLYPGDVDYKRVIESFASNGLPGGSKNLAEDQDPVMVRLTEMAAAEGVVLTDPGVQDRLLRKFRETSPDEYAAAFSPRERERVAHWGRDAWRAIKATARREEINLDHAFSFRRAVALTFKEHPELTGNVATAATFEVALRTVAKRDGFDLHKPADRRSAALVVAKEREDLAFDPATLQRRALKELDELVRCAEGRGGDSDFSWVDEEVDKELGRRGLRRLDGNATDDQRRQYKEVVDHVLATHRDRVVATYRQERVG